MLISVNAPGDGNGSVERCRLGTNAVPLNKQVEFICPQKGTPSSHHAGFSPSQHKASWGLSQATLRQKNIT